MYPLVDSIAELSKLGVVVVKAAVIPVSMASATVPTKKTSKREAKSDQMLP